MSFSISCICIYIFEKHNLYLQENNESIFVKMMSKIDEMLKTSTIIKNTHTHNGYSP